MPIKRFEITEAEHHFRIPVELELTDLVDIDTADVTPRDKHIYRITDTRGRVGWVYGKDWLNDLNRESTTVHGRLVLIVKKIRHREAA